MITIVVLVMVVLVVLLLERGLLKRSNFANLRKVVILMIKNGNISRSRTGDSNSANDSITGSADFASCRSDDSSGSCSACGGIGSNTKSTHTIT